MKTMTTIHNKLLAALCFLCIAFAPLCGSIRGQTIPPIPTVEELNNMSSQEIQDLINIYTGERNALQGYLDTCETEEQDLKAVLGCLASDIELTGVGSLAYELEAAKARLASANDEAAGVRQAKEQAGAEKLLEDFDDHYAVSVEPLKWLISYHEGEIARLKPEIARINGEIKRLENELKEKEKVKNEKKAALDRGDYKTGNAEEAARKELEDLQDEINGIKSQIKDNKREVEPMENEAETTQEILDGFRERVKDADSDREALVSRKEYWEFVLWAAESRVADRQSEVDTIQQDINDIKAEIAGIQAQIAELKERINPLDDAIVLLGLWLAQNF